MSTSFEKVKSSLSKEDIIQILHDLGATTFTESGETIRFRSICHNMKEEDGDYNLAYYPETYSFYCFSSCGTHYDIFSLIVKRSEVVGNPITMREAFQMVVNKANLVDVGNGEGYNPIRGKYEVKHIGELGVYNEKVLNVFEEYYTAEWLDDGISAEVMKRFNILYSPLENSVIIPHYNSDNELVGIRSRLLDKELAEKYGKYMPTSIEGKLYRHPLGFNLYGLNTNKNNISRIGMAIIAEGEKSVLQAETFLGRENNVVCAACGSNINKWQIMKLIKDCTVQEIVIAFDKENDEDGKYYSKLFALCKKYSPYCNFSFIYDTGGLLGEKESPFDKGAEVFYELIDKRIRI